MNNQVDMITAWKMAAEDLKIKIQAPYILKVDDKEISCYLLIEDLGSKKGTIILSTDNMDDFNGPKKLGYYCSALNPLSYSTYDRDYFIDTLNDWRFFGDNDKTPDWYAGKSWT